MKDPIKEQRLPVIDEVLVESLEKLYPQPEYTYKTDQRRIDFESGQQSVVRFLRKHLEIQRTRNKTRNVHLQKTQGETP